MSDMVLGIGSAVWLGILTSISPCPLATNIAAISFIGRRIDSPRAAVATGKALGRFKTIPSKRVYTTPAVHDGVLYYGSGALHAVRLKPEK